MGEKTSKHMDITRYFSEPYGDPYTDPKKIIKYSSREVLITNDQGEVVEKIENAVFPESWGQHAANTVATKYFRKEGVPKTGRELDIRQLAGRVGKKVSQWGLEQGYVDKTGAKNLEDELVSLTIGQYGAFNSPVWFNLGLDLYGIKLEGEDSFYIKNDKVVRAKNFYSHPQVSACFISSPEDSIKDMIQVGAVTSAQIFKGGSGIGGDWSKVRSAGETVSGGGYASGAVRFMDVQDSAARVIKSGGKTRRAATMQSIGIWHPDMVDILRHKYKEEVKARVLIEAGSPSNWESHTIQDLRAQNVNISIRTDDKFWKAYEENKDYEILNVKDNSVKEKIPARKLAKLIAFATDNCGDPGIQNHDIINLWNTCKNSEVIWATNPCAEYNWFNNSSCNLASLNVLRYRLPDGKLDMDSFDKAIDLYITAQDIFVSEASYPTKEVAWNSHIFRPLGLGYSNLGALLMSNGLAYDSGEARDFAAAITSYMTAEAYLQSTRLAEKVGTFQEFEKNKEPMLEVIEMHRKASKKIRRRNGLEELVDKANKKWDEVLDRGNKHGFRNAQISLLAPTGTISFMMGCDTTGCEPEYSLKKYKELSGGGSMTIVNETIPLALENLGYNEEDIKEITTYIEAKGTVEGCEQLNDKDLPVFDCAVCSGEGERFISPKGHLKMLGAIQPHLSGAISKTINCPSNTSMEEIEEMYYQGWKLGIKALAIYRDGSKASQPLKSKKTSKLETLARGDREHLNHMREGIIQKVKVGGTSLFLTTGEYEDGRLGELFIESLERTSEVNRLLNENAIQFSEKIQYGVPLIEALEIFQKAGNSQISGFTDHPFIKTAKGPEGFIYDWIRSQYLGDISFLRGEDGRFLEPEMRPLPNELRIYKKVPKLHLLPTVEGEIMYPGVPSLEDTIKKISGTNYWQDEGMDTRETIEKIKKTRKWNNGSQTKENSNGRITGKTCDTCGTMMVVDGNCHKCPSCKTSTGGCGAG